MGVFIYMDMLPYEVDQEEWEAVYEESLELVRAYSFLGPFVDEDTYGLPWLYGVRADEMELDTNQKGWHVFGDYKTMHNLESFILFRDIEEYRERNPLPEGCPDIIACQMNSSVFINQEERHIPVDSTMVFDAKTEGTTYRKYVLAIACLFESRFPEKVLVSGDITIDQMQDAIEWANTILEKPIQLTERADSENLLERIRRAAWNEYDALTAFMALNMQGEGVALGDLVRKEFRDDTITSYFTNQFKEQGMRIAYYHFEFSRFFRMGFSVEKACEICVLNRDGCQYNAQEFAEMIYTNFVKPIIPSEGARGSMIQDLSAKEVVDKLENTLGELVDLETIKLSVQEETDRAKAKQEESEKGVSKQKEKGFGGTTEEIISLLMTEYYTENLDKKYTINDMKYLILWEPGDTLNPEIEERLWNLKAITAETIEKYKDTFNQFNNESEYEKMQRLILANCYFLIRKDFWDYYIENLNEPDVINKVLGVLYVKANETNMNKLCKSVLNNKSLMKHFIL